MERLNGIDASFLYLETPTTHMHVVGTVVLDPSTMPPGDPFEHVQAALRERMHLLPVTRRRLVGVPGRIDHPVWIEDPDFDVHRHLRRVRLPAPGGRRELDEFVGGVASRPLPRDRPLWEMWLVEGLADGTLALVTKLHHSTMDGSAGREVMTILFDLAPEGGTVSPPTEQWEPDRVPSPPELLLRGLRGRAGELLGAPRALAHAGRSAVDVTRMLLSRRRGGDGEVAVPLTAPRTPFSGVVTDRRAVAFARCRFDDLKAVKQAFEVTVNDVVLAATAGVLRDYLVEHDALPDKPLIAAVPVAVRTEEQRHELGNRVSTLMVGLPVSEADPIRRLRRIHDNTSTAKAVHGALGPQMLQEWTGLAPPNVLTGGARLYSGLRLAGHHPPIMNLVVSNVAGPPVPLYCAGARVLAVYPMGPVMEGTGLNITVLSNLDELDVGVITCRDMLDTAEAEAIADGFAAHVAALRDLAGPEGSSATA